MSDIGNPPAFPHHPGYANGSEGMTLLDYFAAAALTGLLSDHEIVAKQHEWAEAAYKIADAMLKERNK